MVRFAARWIASVTASSVRLTEPWSFVPCNASCGITSALLSSQKMKCRAVCFHVCLSKQGSIVIPHHRKLCHMHHPHLTHELSLSMNHTSFSIEISQSRLSILSIMTTGMTKSSFKKTHQHRYRTPIVCGYVQPPNHTHMYISSLQSAHPKISQATSSSPSSINIQTCTLNPYPAMNLTNNQFKVSRTTGLQQSPYPRLDHQAPPPRPSSATFPLTSLRPLSPAVASPSPSP